MSKLNNARHSPVVKAGAFLLCLVLGSACFWSGYVTLNQWNDIWLGGDYYRSGTAMDATNSDVSHLYRLLGLKQRLEYEGSLTYSEQEELRTLENAFSPDKTNFRFQVHDDLDGTPILNNLGGELLDRAVPVQYMTTGTLTLDENLYRSDADEYSEELDLYFKMVNTGKEIVACDPRGAMDGYNQYGWYSDSGYRLSDYDAGFDTRVQRRTVTLEYGIAEEMTAQDAYMTGRANYERVQGYLPALAAVALVTALGTLALAIFLCSAAGRREDGSLAAGWQERIPYDVYLLADILLLTVVLSGTDAMIFPAVTLNRAIIVGRGVFTLAGVALGLGLLLTTAVRIKTRTHNALIGRCLRAMGRFIGGIGRNWPATKKLTLLFILYLLGTILTALTLVLIPLYQGFVLWALCRWLRQWRAIREGTERIVGGDPDVKIDTTGMYRELRRHAEQLNDLGGAVNSAVEEQLKSERFKAELITNVSHDLKTPLTSIINYVDLLKKLPIENSAASEYIEVLDRKSQRLKKLTEDLVEASKASTGNLPVVLERLGMGQLLVQALAEYEERFAAGRLEVVPAMPHDELWIWADGRHLWRVIDNLLSNCAKYAMAGTRVYVDVSRWEGSVYLSVKNISRQALNVPPEQLMERFIRGEESRTTEGSGLGLSIARSLTELQGGSFRLEIDGDLFKAVVSFPEAAALPQAEPDFELPKAE